MKNTKILFVVLLCFVFMGCDISFANYINTIDEGAIVREKPDISAKIIKKIDGKAIFLILKKEKTNNDLWYMIANVWENVEIGWVNKNELQELDIKENIDFETANGFEWETSYLEIEKLSKLITVEEYEVLMSEIEDDDNLPEFPHVDVEQWEYMAVIKNSSFNESWLKIDEIDIYYLFNKDKRLIGYYFSMMRKKDFDKNVYRLIIENKIGETQNIHFGEDGFYSEYNFKKFSVLLSYSSFGKDVEAYVSFGVVMKKQ